MSRLLWASLRASLAASLAACSMAGVAFAKPADLPVGPRLNTAAESPAEAPGAEITARAEETFARAERHREAGQIAEARRLYQEAHILAPTSRVGQQAIARLRDLEMPPTNDFSEEQEPPLLRQTFRPNLDLPRTINLPAVWEYLEMLRTTRPLDLAPPVRNDY